ncbi:MAG TPA: hypothetical protein VM779_03425, partial [Thermoanaerobaculia bacterium]|nr:hypothetical protein [Thermoanaerobaculia bacterium]
AAFAVGGDDFPILGADDPRGNGGAIGTEGHRRDGVEVVDFPVDDVGVAVAAGEVGRCLVGQRILCPDRAFGETARVFPTFGEGFLKRFSRRLTGAVAILILSGDVWS